MSVTLVPAACVMVATGCVVIVGAMTALPELDDDELLELELEEEDDEPEELLLLAASVVTLRVELLALTLLAAS